jgi:putative tryptophan/tyrosine transport system substrate-binding protein
MNSTLKTKNSKLAFLAVALCFGLAANAHAQQAKKVYRIGYLSARGAAGESARREVIRTALRDAGYIEGKNLVIEYRYADGERERFSALSAELIRLKVDIILVAGGDAAVRAAVDATKTIPIVMSGGGADPVDIGLVKSLARPGGNVTGLTNRTADLSGKRLELLKEVIPRLARVAVLYEPANSQSVTELKETIPPVARALGLTIHPWEISDADDFDKTFAGLRSERADGFYVSPGALTNTHLKRIVGFALKSRLPSVYARKEYVEEGGLLCYGADSIEQYQRVVWYADKILKGVKPGDLPIEQPTKFELVINLKTAKQIGVTIPQSALYKADRVIK